LTERLSLRVATDPRELPAIATAVDGIARRENWSPDLVFRVNLVLEELAANINHHAHDDAGHEIEIVLNSERDRLTIEVIDDGRPFDPLEDAPKPDLTASLEERPVGGLGLHLVRSLVDDLQYRRADGKNHLALVALRDR
jgi:anti-sigma regulatory factor (Ser/Thr protein kinase)